MPKVLLTSICRPIGERHGDGKSVGYELLFGQVTRAQGLFSPRATHIQYSLEYIANNLDAPATVLQYPSKRELIRELKRNEYDYVGMAFILSTFHRMKESVALIRKYAPKAKIVLGGYGTVMSDEELAPWGDYICREEGVGFMRRLLGEPERPLPYDHPVVISKLKVFSWPVSKTGMVFGGLGCPNGCDFCCTSHFFKRRHIRLLQTGKDIYDVMCRYQDKHGVDSFTVLDEDFLLNKKRALEFLELVRANKRTFSIFAFASMKALSLYELDDLSEMGIDGVWIGYEGTRSGYAKQQGRTPPELFPDLARHGILVLASMIVGFDYQDQATIDRELQGLLRLRPALSQFLIYGPTPGTPFYERMKQEDRFRPIVHEDRLAYYRQATGFSSMVTHPRMSKEEIEAAQQKCFETDYQRLGPSILRSLRVWFCGYENLRRSKRPALRRKARQLGDEVRKAYPLFMAARLYAPNKRIRQWAKAMERRVYQTLGQPNLKEQALAYLGVAAAAWTRFTLNFDAFQHPRLVRTRHRWQYLPEQVTRLWGEILESGAAAELRVMWERKAAEGFAWVKLEGAVDGKIGEQLAARLRAGMEKGREQIGLNLEKVQYLDRKGLAAFYKAFRKYRRRIKIKPPAALPSGAPDLKALYLHFRIQRPEAGFST